jgi:hypothetical protein
LRSFDKVRRVVLDVREERNIGVGMGYLYDFPDELVAHGLQHDSQSPFSERFPRAVTQLGEVRANIMP